MEAGTVIKYSILFLLVILYLIYTIRYIKKIRNNILFSKRLKIFHGIMIWLIPFLWIFLIENFTKTASGSYKIEKKEEDVPYYNPYDLPSG